MKETRIEGTENNNLEETEKMMIEVCDENGPSSYLAAAEILKKFGIGGITDKLIKEHEKYDTEDFPFNRAAMLLVDVGSGITNHETQEWIPSENGVYTFDMEVFDLKIIYTNFLRGVSALNKGKLNFQNIKEDTSEVDWDSGTGRRKVSFEWNEETYILSPKENHDWFDVKIADELSKIIMEHSDRRKRLYFSSDEEQGLIVFYRDADWAREFQKETGLELSETPW